MKKVISLVLIMLLMLTSVSALSNWKLVRPEKLTQVTMKEYIEYRNLAVPDPMSDSNIEFYQSISRNKCLYGQYFDNDGNVMKTLLGVIGKRSYGDDICFIPGSIRKNEETKKVVVVNEPTLDPEPVCHEETTCNTVCHNECYCKIVWKEHCKTYCVFGSCWNHCFSLPYHVNVCEDVCEDVCTTETVCE